MYRFWIFSLDSLVCISIKGHEYQRYIMFFTPFLHTPWKNHTIMIETSLAYLNARLTITTIMLKLVLRQFREIFCFERNFLKLIALLHTVFCLCYIYCSFIAYCHCVRFIQILHKLNIWVRLFKNYVATINKIKSNHFLTYFSTFGILFLSDNINKYIASNMRMPLVVGEVYFKLAQITK